MTLYISAKCKANNGDISGICHNNKIMVGLIFSGMFCMKQHTRIYFFSCTSWKIINYIRFLKKDLSNRFAVALQRTGCQFHLFQHVMAEDLNAYYVESQFQ